MVVQHGVEAIESFKSWLNYTKKKIKKEREDEIKYVKLSKLDDDLMEKINEVSRDEVYIKKRMLDNRNNNDKLYWLGLLKISRSQKNFYLNLGQMRKQERINEHLNRLTKLILGFMIIQIVLMLYQILT